MAQERVDVLHVSLLGEQAITNDWARSIQARSSRAVSLVAFLALHVMTTRPAIAATTNIRDAAEFMTTRRYRHLPVTGDAGLLGVLDVTDVCRALSGAQVTDSTTGSPG